MALSMLFEGDKTQLITRRHVLKAIENVPQYSGWLHSNTDHGWVIENWKERGLVKMHGRQGIWTFSAAAKVTILQMVS